jgi:hypothetical protein
MKRTTQLITTIAGLAMMVSIPTANAQENAAPLGGHCFGASTTCLVPELTFDVSRVALNGPDSGKLSAGAVPLGAGYALLFAYDQWYASGPAVHAILDYQQTGASMIQISGMATLARYFHVGVVYERLGAQNLLFASGGLTLPIDLVTSAIANKKMKAARAARAE